MTVHVHLRCPACGHEWHAATIDTASWWGKGITPETVARQCYCRSCEQAPPMHVVGQVTQQIDLLCAGEESRCTDRAGKTVN